MGVVVTLNVYACSILDDPEGRPAAGVPWEDAGLRWPTHPSLREQRHSTRQSRGHSSIQASPSHPHTPGQGHSAAPALAIIIGRVSPPSSSCCCIEILQRPHFSNRVFWNWRLNPSAPVLPQPSYLKINDSKCESSFWVVLSSKF